LGGCSRYLTEVRDMAGIDECPECGGWLGEMDSELVFEGEVTYCEDCDEEFIAWVDGEGTVSWELNDEEYDEDEDECYE